MAVKDWERGKLLAFAYKKGASCEKSAVVVSSIIELLKLPEAEGSRYLIPQFETLAEMYLREMDLWGEIVNQIQKESKIGPPA